MPKQGAWISIFTEEVWQDPVRNKNRRAFPLTRPAKVILRRAQDPEGLHACASGRRPLKDSDREIGSDTARWMEKTPSRLERQTDILLRQRRLGVLGPAQIVELVEPHPFLERCLIREAVEQHRQPPGYAGRRPHAAERRV
jgi:hypothetical protein